MDQKGLVKQRLEDHDYDDEENNPLYEFDHNRQMLRSKRMEDRYKMAHEPLRVCNECYEQLKPIQQELRATNSNAVRFNTIDPTSARRLFNSPVAFTLGHEIRKAAYTLNNLLPMPRRIGYYEESTIFRNFEGNGDACQTVTEACAGGQLSPNLANLDGVRIPARLISMARGIAIMTVIKCGLGLGIEFGTGLVVARLKDNLDGRTWSAPSAIGLAGVSWGALAGAQVSDHVFLLMTDRAVEMLAHDDGSVQLGADLGVALGPIGRSVEGNFGMSGNAMSAIYTYSLSKGLYAGLSLDGKLISTRHKVNEKFYGMSDISARDLLTGKVPTPPAAQPLYDALKRCHVYASQRGVASVPMRQVVTRRESELHSRRVAYDNDPSEEYGSL